MLGLDVAGFICSYATANVTIVLLSPNSGDVLLVLRHDCEGEEVCDIFGQSSGETAIRYGVT